MKLKQMQSTNVWSVAGALALFVAHGNALVAGQNVSLLGAGDAYAASAPSAKASARDAAVMTTSAALDSAKCSNCDAPEWFESYLPAFNRCYQGGIARDPSLSGWVLFELKLKSLPNGRAKVADVAVEKHYTMGDPLVTTCVVNELGSATVDVGQTPVDNVQLPLLFQATTRESKAHVEFPARGGEAPATAATQPVEFILGDAPSQGSSKAEVTVVEFTDFQCPHCAIVHDTMKALVVQYGSRLRFVSMAFPLPFHQKARLASAAALAAAEQGKFWEYQDLLFAHPDALDEAALVFQAQTLGLDLPRFRKALSSQAVSDEIDREVQEGTRAGVEGVPYAFINGRLIMGARPIEDFKKEIDAELAKLH
jgi:protein-disulfide isomerase